MAEYELPAVMAAAQALAEAGGDDRISQGDLRDAEKAILAASCPQENCSFWRGHNGDCSEVLNKKLADSSRAVQLLEALVESGNQGPLLEVAREFLRDLPR